MFPEGCNSFDTHLHRISLYSDTKQKTINNWFRASCQIREHNPGRWGGGVSGKRKDEQLHHVPRRLQYSICTSWLTFSRWF